MTDFKNGELKSLLHNSQLQFEKYVKTLLKYLKSKQSSLIYIIADKESKAENVNAFGACVPLVEPVTAGHQELVKIFLDSRCNVDKPDYNCRSPLFIACSLQNEALVKLFLIYKADITQCDKHGCSSLLKACETGNHDIVQVLLHKGGYVGMSCTA